MVINLKKFVTKKGLEDVAYLSFMFSNINKCELHILFYFWGCKTTMKLRFPRNKFQGGVNGFTYNECWGIVFPKD